MIKHVLLYLWPLMSRFVPNGSFKNDVARRVYLKQLFRKDPALWRVELARDAGVKVGKNCRFYSFNFFSEPFLVEIGDNVIISGEVILVTHDGAIYLFKDEIKDVQGSYGRIKIGNNCFLGMGAIILPNVTIGSNCIIGAGAVVNTSIPDNSVVMGNPAKVAFKTDMYKKLKMNSIHTIINPEYAFPKRMTPEVRREILLKHYNDIPPAPIPKPRKRKKGPRAEDRNR